ncbi:MAG TPA: DUF885 domain-containing protein [Acidobacteriota bacterium]|nr:DUF885 domain-containing protein [Acidobacteriota bacterium]
MPSVRRTQAAVLVATLAAGCTQPALDHGAQLEGLIAGYIEARYSESTTPRDLRAAAFVGRIAADRILLAQLRDVATGSLSRSQRIDRAYLIGALEADIFDAETARRWETDPTTYIPAGSIAAALDATAAEPMPASRQQLLALLEGIPPAVEAARANLGSPPRRFTEAAIFEISATLAALRERRSPTPGAQIDPLLVDATDVAIEALHGFEGYLRNVVLPRSDGDWAIGTERYDYLVQHRWMLDADADAILERGQRAFDETEARAQEVAERIAPGMHWIDVYESIKDDHPPFDAIKDAYQSQMDAARAFVRERQVVTLPDSEHVVTVDTPLAMRRSSPFGTFQTVRPFDDGVEGRLVLTPIDAELPADQRLARSRSHHHAWTPIIAVHEAYPGHHVHALKARDNPRPLRRVAAEPITLEGWGLFTESLMFELGFLAGDEVELTILRNRLWRAARVILDVSLHTGRMGIRQAVDFLVDRVRFERSAAELEVGMYPRRPTYVLGYLIGMQEIERLRDDWVAANGPPNPPSTLYDALLSAGGIPPALIRAELLGEETPEP